MNKFTLYAVVGAVLLMGIANKALATHPKPPHGFWTGKVVNVAQSSITISSVESWEYGSDRRQIGRKDMTFKPGKPGFTIDEKPIENQNIARHFKVGEIVTLRWIYEEDRKNHIFFDISKGR